MLPLGDDLQMPVPVFDSVLDSLLQEARIDADALFGPGNDDGGFR